MNRSSRPPVSLISRWIGIVLALAVLLALALEGLRQVQQVRLAAGERVLRDYAAVTHDLAMGFLDLTLSGKQAPVPEAGPGMAVLHRALAGLQAAARNVPEPALAQQLLAEIAIFEKQLGDEAARAETLAGAVSLHEALDRLHGTVDAVDRALRSHQQARIDRYSDLFGAAIFGGLLLLLVLSYLAIRALRAQRRLERELLDSESQFRGLVEQSIAAVVIVREGRITYANSRITEIMRCQVKDLVGRSMLDFVVERDRDETLKELVKLDRDPAAGYTGFLRVNRADGTEALLDMQANPVMLNGGPALLGILHDVTEKVRIERERLDALQMVDSIVKGSGDAVFVRDLDGRYVMFSPRAEEIFNTPASKVLGRDSNALFGPEVVSEIRRTDLQICEDQQVRRFERQVQGLRGPLMIHVTLGPLVNSQGKVTAIFGVTRDISDSKAQEKALEDSRAELVAMFDALEEGLVVFDTAGRILRMNPAALRINGLDAELGRRILDVDDRHEIIAFESVDGQPLPVEGRPSQRILAGESVRNYECVLLNRVTGLRRTLLCNGSLVRSTEGEVRLGLLTFTDITDRRRAEQAMLQSQRLESLGTLAAGIAHDFNNILLAIIGNASLADADLPPGHAAHTGLQEVLRAGQRAKDLVSRILLFARAEVVRRQTGNLRDVVAEAVELMRPSLPTRVHLHAELPVDAVNVDMDASQIHQVVVNLVTNAAHSIEDIGPEHRGEVRVRLDLAQHESGTCARIEVIDEGCGMDAAVMDRVFDPFFTTKDVGRGTGLGLSIVRGIVEDHQGSVELQSEPGKGTRVRIQLPLSQGRPSALPAARTESDGAGRHVLYIDDEPALVSLVTRYLQRQGYQVTGETDPAKGLDLFRSAPGDFDLVVTDLSMPDMSGFDVVQAVRAVSPSVPILMMSGYVRPEDRERALAMGVREVLLKPSTVSDLCESIDRELR